MLKLHPGQAYLGPYQISVIEYFCKQVQRLLTVNYFRKKTPLQMFDRILNTPMKDDDKIPFELSYFYD